MGVSPPDVLGAMRVIPLDTGTRKLLLYQFLLVSVAAVLILVLFDMAQVISSGFGYLIAVVNAILATRCAQRDTEAKERTPEQSLAALYICVLQRFVMAVALFAIGLGALALTPFALLAGFIAGQLIMVIIGTQQLKRN